MVGPSRQAGVGDCSGRRRDVEQPPTPGPGSAVRWSAWVGT